MSSLADVILGNPEDTARVPMLRQGIVTQVSPLMVQVGAATSSLACRTLASYVPTAGDAVSVLVISGDRLVLGRASVTGGGPPVDTTQFVKKTGDTMTGALTVNGGDIVTSNWLYSQAGYLVLGPNAAPPTAGWYDNGDHWLRSLNDRGVWIGGGHFAANGSIFIGYNGVGDPGYAIDVNANDGRPCRFSSGAQAPWYRGPYDTGTAMDFPSGGGAIRWVIGGGVPWEARQDAVTSNQRPIRLFSVGDPNHGIRYNSTIDGVEIDGWSMVRIFLPPTGATFDHSNDGHLYATNTYIVTSSITLKENVADLSDIQALGIVRGLRPVTYDRRDGERDRVGFVAEWTRDVAPFAVSDNDDEVPGIDYAGFTPVLTKVMQTVLDRLDALEANHG